MPGHKGVITVSSSYEHAYECDVECVEYRDAVKNTTELASRIKALIAEALELNHHVGSFEPAEGTNPLDLDNSNGKMLMISADLDPK